MADNIVNLSVVQTQRAGTDLDGCAQALRERVDSGEAVAIAYAVINKDGSVSTNYVHGAQLMALIGAAHHLAARLEREINVP